MLTLTIRTDKPDAEIGLYEDDKQLAYVTWLAHRQLAETMHGQVRELLHSQDKMLQDLTAIACYAGPGSFTGLRIGLSVANALSYALQVPIVAETGGDWQDRAIKRLQNGDVDPLAVPQYGTEVHITLPKTAPNRA